MCLSLLLPNTKTENRRLYLSIVDGRCVQSDPLIDLADLLRRPKGVGVEARSAVLDGKARYDIVRGKDLVRWMQANHDTVNMPFVRARAPEEMASELAVLLLRRGFLIRCERKFKKPPPGMERLAKFPKKVISVNGPDRFMFEESSFYAWTWERPMSAMTYILAGLAAASVILICLFPIAPYWFKAGVLYVASGLLAMIFGLLILRGIMAVVSYVATGRTVWFLPNILADDKPISELFKPVVAVQEPEPLTSRKTIIKHYLSRLIVGAMCVAFTLVLMHNAPDRASVQREAGRYRDEIFDWLISDRRMISAGQGQQSPSPNIFQTPNSSEGTDGDSEEDSEL